MADELSNPTRFQRKISPKLRLFLAVGGTAQTVLTIAFAKWVMHESWKFYLYAIPGAAFFSIFALRPDWIVTWNRMTEESFTGGWKTLDKKKWNWPGFPSPTSSGLFAISNHFPTENHVSSRSAARGSASIAVRSESPDAANFVPSEIACLRFRHGFSHAAKLPNNTRLQPLR
jgi:hypothetical protein